MSPWAAFLSWLGQAAVVALGWYVVDRLSASRDRDKARRETVIKAADTLSDSVNTLLADARIYHSEVRDRSKELLIKMAIQDISLQINALSEIALEHSILAHCRSRVISLRRSITGVHFEDEHLGALSNGDSQYQGMAESVLDLKRVLLQLKHKQFLD